VRILVVGGGAREDALSWRLAQSPSCEAIFHAPGNAGTATRGTNFPEVAATDTRAILDRAKANAIDLTVIGPETSLAAGVGDRLRDAGLNVFGPNRSGARLESSKIFAKRFMERHGIPTARFAVVHSLAGARKALDQFSGGVVVKADGLAAGKGVVVCDDADAAATLLRAWYEKNAIPGGGADVVLEERMSGREISVFAIADGRAMIPIAAACDYKRAGDDDRGPNTGGMGAYSPPFGFPDNVLEIVRESVIAPALRGLLAEDEIYRGVLYVGLMWTAAGPRVVEFNARFGDPETQVLMLRLMSDLVPALLASRDGQLKSFDLRWYPDPALTVVMATKGYPGDYARGSVIEGLDDAAKVEGVEIFHAGTKTDGTRILANGGRVLDVSAIGKTVREAQTRAYEAISRIRWPEGFYRHDIGWRAIERETK
jgi:phosphoribosylamine--glycine ligase